MSVEASMRKVRFSLVRDTVVASIVLAAAIGLVAAFTGHLAVGVGLGAGVLIGSGNGYLVGALLDRGAPIVQGSILRLVFLSALALGAALFLGSAAWSVLLGVGIAQFVMVAAAVRRGLRA
ncbi:MAG TPA: hypothetical protein VF990_06040 [Candidatus Dormibacteraeota bacterium]